jgi:hypothetical protein
VGRDVELRASMGPGAWRPAEACLDVWRGLSRVGGDDRQGGACALADGRQVLAWTWRAPCAGPSGGDELTLEVSVPLGHRVRTMPEIEALVGAVDETIRNASTDCGR